ncbi:MAG: PHP domain-containing protein [Planctomycetes bacterium]|nr:PHP domain-containing protein [Planctomycetota bacterium]
MRSAPLLLLVCLLASCASDPPRWYKGNLHTHTLWSDGNHFPEMVVDWYAQRDYDFLALTDHNIVADHEKWMANDVVVRRGGRTALADYRARFGTDHVDERTVDGKLEVRLQRLDEIAPLFGDLLLIPAEEITSSFDKKPIHINASNVAGRIAPEQGDSVQDVMRRTLRAVQAHAAEHDRPVLAHLNHPNFGWGVSADDLAQVTEEHFFEVWNGHPSVHHRGDETRPGVERLWDIANTTRRRDLDAALLYGLATDDCHNYHNASGSTPGRGWVMVRAVECTPEALLGAIERGDFYASSGVVLDQVTFDGTTMTIDIAAQGDASYVTEFVGTRRDGEVGEVLARVEGERPSYRVRGDEWFVRATVTSTLPVDNPVWEGQRRQAWVQPVVPGTPSR